MPLEARSISVQLTTPSPLTSPLAGNAPCVRIDVGVPVNVAWTVPDGMAAEIGVVVVNFTDPMSPVTVVYELAANRGPVTTPRLLVRSCEAYTLLPFASLPLWKPTSAL